MQHLAIPRCIHAPNLDSYLKEYRIYAPNMMPILEIKSQVKVTVTRKWNRTIRHSKMHSHTKFGIPTSNNIRDMLRYKKFQNEVGGQV